MYRCGKFYSYIAQPRAEDELVDRHQPTLTSHKNTFSHFSTNYYNMEEEEIAETPAPTEELRCGAKKLAYYVENSFRLVFHVLDFKKEGNINKSSVQVICANICRVLDILYMPEHLAHFNGEGKKIDEETFLEYFRQLVRKAAVAGNPVDDERLDNVAWVIVNKVRSPEHRILSGADTFLLLRIFNKIDIQGDLVIHKEEVASILENFMKAIGTPWTPVPMDNFSTAEFWTFWKLLECLETKYIQSTPQSLYVEGFRSIEDTYLKEIAKAGNLTKKGHKVKSLKERWFVLQPGKMSYYVTKSMRDLKGVIVINSSAKVKNISDSRNGKCMFSVTCGEKNIEYEVQAETQKEKNEWMNLIQATIDHEKAFDTVWKTGKWTTLVNGVKDAKDGNSLLYNNLVKRRNERAERQRIREEEERKRQEQDDLIKQQMQELERLKLAQEKAEAQAEVEAALLEEERKRREELEILKAEYEKLLDDERKAREDEENVRKLQERILEEERQKREDLEAIKAMQEELLEQERKQREGLEEESKEQAKVLEEERQRMKELDEARQKAEEAVAETRAKLEAAEEERRRKAEAVESAKNKTRKMKIPEGLAKPLSLAIQGFVTHRGAGAFIDEDFVRKTEEPEEDGIERPEAVNKTVDDGSQRAVIVESNLVKPSEKGSFLIDE